MNESFKCNCGVTALHSSKSIPDRKHGVLRCHSCYDIYHKAEIVKKNARRKEQMIDRLCLQEKERKAKARKALECVEFGIKTKESIYTKSIQGDKLKNKKRYDAIMSDIELKKIEEEYLKIY